MGGEKPIKSVAIVGAGAAGAITAAAFKAENYYERIQVFERRETSGGTWIHDPDPGPELAIRPGKLPPETDPRLHIPDGLPRITAPNQQERFSKTPIYNSLTTNVPEIAMSFSDRRFAYGPFAPHYVPRQYVESYFTAYKLDKHLVLNTTVEDISRVPGTSKWKLTLRRYDPARHVDIWWHEVFDAVILANGHYAVPFIPEVEGLEAYTAKFPGRVVHSKYYRSPLVYASKKVLTIGNSASGHDLTAELVSTAHLPVHNSVRSKSRWDGDEPPPGIAWKPIIKKFHLDGRIEFEDGSILDDIDTVIYCTGYRVSFPFWNIEANGRPLWDYEANKLIKGYWHTFFQDFPTLGIVGIQRALTFRSFEYQAVALARLFAGRNALPLPPLEEQQRWEHDREHHVKQAGQKFHDIVWEGGETFAFLGYLFRLAGLGTLTGEGRIPPVLGKELIWAVEHIRKYPEPGRKDEAGNDDETGQAQEQGDTTNKKGQWVVVDRPRGYKGSLLGFL